MNSKKLIEIYLGQKAKLRGRNLFLGEYVIATKDCESTLGDFIPEGRKYWLAKINMNGYTLVRVNKNTESVTVDISTFNKCFKKINK